MENTAEEIMDAINVLQLLRGELEENQDDPHIIRTIGIVLKILQSALSKLQHMKED